MKKTALCLAALLIAGCGRATVATQASPGALAAQARLDNPTPLQKHVMFFDANKDGILTIEETEAGLKRLGLGGGGALGAAVLIHAGLRKAAEGSKIVIAKIQSAKHKSDTGAFDADGRFVPAAFERMLTFDKDKSGSFSSAEFDALIAANKTDTLGNVAAKGEFGLLLKLGADTTVREGGKDVPAVSRARLESVYDGTLFYKIAEERAKTHKEMLE